MDTSTGSATRRTAGLGALLIIIGSVGFLPRAWLVHPEQPPELSWKLYQLLLNAFLLVLGAGAVLGSRIRFKRDAFRVLAYGSFLGLAALSVGPSIAAQLNLGIQMLRPLGSMLIAVGTAGLWGTALARRDDPANPESKRLSLTYASVAIAGIAASTLPELLNTAMLMGSPGSLSRNSPYLLMGLVQLPARLCILWACIQPFRKLPDDDGVRKSARSTHVVLVVWVILTLLGWVSMMLVYLPRRSSNVHFSMSETAILWRMLAYYALLATAVTSVAHSLRNPDPASGPSPS